MMEKYVLKRIEVLSSHHVVYRANHHDTLIASMPCRSFELDLGNFVHAIAYRPACGNLANFSLEKNLKILMNLHYNHIRFK